jgi:hypothetical protein
VNLGPSGVRTADSKGYPPAILVLVLSPITVSSLLVCSRTDTTVHQSSSTMSQWGPAVRLLAEDSIKSIDEGSIKSISEESIQSISEGSIQSIDEGSIKSISEGSIQSIDEGSIKSTSEGSIQSIDEGSIKSTDEGSIKSIGEGSIKWLGAAFLM